MPIDFQCSNCGQKLRVADSNAGKRAKCPRCQTELLVPSPVVAPAAALSATPAAAAGSGNWHVKTSDGTHFGPVSRSELNEWLQEGRLDSETQLLQEGWDQWKWANEVFPSLDAQHNGGGAANPFDFGNAAPSNSNPYAPTYAATGFGGAGVTGGYGGTVKPHRGSTIMTLGILSFFINPCLIISILAWTWGNQDLQEMRLGRMDRSGESQTRTGRMCGIISLCMSLGGLVILMMLMVAGGLAQR